MNKFASILQTARDPEVTEQPAAAPTPPILNKTTRPVGRPAGKRTDPEYQQVTAYVRKDTWRQVKIALLQDAKQGAEPQETSELIEDLLAEWLQSRS